MPFCNWRGIVLRIEKEFILREIAGDYILVPVGNTALEFNGLLTVNEIGAFLWERMKKETTIDALTAAVLEEYEVDADTARKDVEEFVASLQKVGIVS